MADHPELLDKLHQLRNVSIVSAFLAFFVKFRRLIATFFIPILFFSYYNMFLIDNTLENLRFSLEQTAIAYDIEDTNGLDIILSQATTEKIHAREMNAFEIGNLEYATDIVNTGTHFNQLDYLKVAIKTAIKQEEKKRGIVLTMLDRINKPIRKTMIYLAYLPRYLFAPRLAHAQTADSVAQLTLLEQIRSIEKDENLQEMASEYEKLMRVYPEPEKTALIMLRLAYTYHRMAEYDKASKLYEKVARTYYQEMEGKIAQILLDGLKQKDNLIKEANRLIIEASGLTDKDAEKAQDLFYLIAIIYTKLFNFEEANKFFRRAAVTDPLSELAVKSQFNLAWILKKQNKLEESFEEFSKIIKEKPTSKMVLDTRYQLADVYRTQGKFQEAIDIQAKIVEENEDNEEIASLCLFQIAASYMYDLNDTKKAKEIFAELTRKYPNSIYAQYLAPEKSFIGMFLTYVVPRATDIVTWRMAGIFCISGYFGELAQARLVSEEAGLNVAVNDWCLEEFPDSIGDIYYDMKAIEITMAKDNITVSGNLTFGQFSVKGEAELHFELNDKNQIRLVVTKAFLNKIPIPPVLINHGLTKLLYLLNTYFPVMISDISIEEGKLLVEAYGNKRMLGRIKKSTGNRLGAQTEIEEIQPASKQAEVYAMFREKFPESDFTPHPTYGTKELFLDFFTRTSLYAAFKLLETVKDSKLDYQRSIRTLGRLTLKESRFRVNYTQEHVNASISRFVTNEFPWLVSKKFLFDVIGLEVHFKDNGEVDFESYLGLGYSETFPMEPQGVRMKGTVVLEVDKKSKLLKIVFKRITLNEKELPVEKLNLVVTRCLDILTDAHIPFKLEQVKVYEGGVMLKGKAPRDYSARLFSDPYLFVIFHVRGWDLGLAGIERLREPVSLEYEDYRGRVWKKGGAAQGPDMGKFYRK